MKDRIYIFGLILVILSFIACTISYFLIIFALPVFIIGVIIIFFSKKKLSTKLISVIAPLILYLPFTYLFLSLYGRTTPVTFLIPSDYEGQFCIVYGEKCGINPPCENGRLVFKIPHTGVLIVQPKFEAGIVNNEYYLLDENDNRKKINELYFYKDRSKKMPAVLLGSSGSIGGAMPDGSFSSESPLAITYTEFTLYNKDSTLADIHKTEQLIDSLVNQCRRK